MGAILSEVLQFEIVRTLLVSNYGIEMFIYF